MKLLIDIPEKAIAHIRSNYGHGYKGLYDEDRDKIIDAIYHGIPLDNVKTEIAEEICLTDNLYTRETKYTIEYSELLEILDNIGKAESENKE